MKFGKSLSSQVVQVGETLPGWRDKYLAYKDLKKWLNLLLLGDAAGAGAGEPRRKRRRVIGGAAPPMTPEDASFVALLEAELDKLNGFFLDKEEEYVILQKELREDVVRAAEMGSAEELMRVQRKIVDFHGEMVLLESYSELNYTGLVKILKKYDKRTGALIRLPFIQKVLQQPFYTTDLLYKLVKDCEAMLGQLVPPSEPSEQCEDGKEDDGDSDGEDGEPPKPSSYMANGGAALGELDEIDDVKSMYMKSMEAAFRALREIRSRSSTPSVFSLPPLYGSISGQEEQER